MQCVMVLVLYSRRDDDVCVCVYFLGVCLVALPMPPLVPCG